DINSAVDATQFTAMGAITLTNLARIGSAQLLDGVVINGGNVFVQAGDLAITTGAQISSSIFGAGNGGDINVIADSLLIDGTGALVTGIFADALSGSTGKAGNISAQARDVKLVAGGEIASSAFGIGN